MGKAGAGEVGVDLVGHHHHVVAQADLPDAAQLLGRPAAAHRVVGVAEDEELGARLHEHALEALVVHGVAPILVEKRARERLAAVVHDHRAEGVVHGRLDDHGVAGLGEGVDGHGQGEHHARRHDEPLALGAPAVARLEPALHGLVVAVQGHRVAEDAVLGALHERLDGAGGRLEVHVGHPEGQVVGGMSAPVPRVPLQAARAATVDDALEVVLRHERPPNPSLCLRRPPWSGMPGWGGR